MSFNWSPVKLQKFVVSPREPDMTESGTRPTMSVDTGHSTTGCPKIDQNFSIADTQIVNYFRDTLYFLIV